MLDLLKRYSRLSVIALCLIAALVSTFYHGRSQEPTPIALTLSGITTPGLGVLDGLVRGVAGTWSSYIALTDLQEENVRLKRELDALRGSANKAERLRVQNRRLKKLVGFKDENATFEMVGARVIAKDISAHYRVVKISLDVGGDDRIRNGMPVVSHDGIVGRIARTDGENSEVMLVVDKRSSMDVRIAGKGITGTLKGVGVRNEYEAQFRFLHRNKPLKKGDVIVTSGHDQVFPSGFEVGRIISEDAVQSGIYYVYKVRPAVNFSTLEEVFVLVNEKAQMVEEQ